MNSLFKGKKVLVIGGTGTIGTHLINELLKYETKVIRVFSRDEHKQFMMQQEMDDPHNRMRFLIGDVRDYNRVLRAMEDIDYVFHLAALKHVPFCEYNPFEAVQTNIIGTQNVIQAATQSGVEKVLFTSTDKAISPTNTYGATKLTAERLISAAEYQKGPKSTAFFSVRFGNVMGSRGSVIPLFKQKILDNKELTVTDLSMSRYMMTPNQAISLMLKSFDIVRGGEVFVLKMPIINLADLTEVIIKITTKKYNITTPVSMKEIGLRPGEKLYEELMTDEEYKDAIELEDMFVLPPFFKKEKTMPNKKNSSPYRSHEGTPIDRKTLEEWIIAENLI